MNKFMKKIMSKKDGFTLVELIVVIAILAILAGVAVPVYSGYIKKAEAAKDTQTLSAIYTAVVASVADQSGVTIDLIEVDAEGNVYLNNAEDAYADPDYLLYIGTNSTVLTSETYADGATWEATVWTAGVDIDDNE